MRLSTFQSLKNRDSKGIRFSCIYPRVIYPLFSRICRVWWTMLSPEPLPMTPICSPPPSPEEEAIITVIHGFLAALNAKSSADFEKYCIRAGGMSLWPPPPMVPRFCTIGVFVEQIANVQDEIDERIWDPEVKVYELGNMAAVWAPFRSKINGVVNHVGVELFVLHKLNGEWKVTGLADSCRWATEEEKNSLL
ncbi:hypothetical protein BDV30DRAFT_4438 [Aspergillus minisclerotigenes]|uniref:SnoaL-like domain-containing protein n=1 Tax=Aspergillus minisclerotigenes TaxID=656917 RepID=A0A5N6JP97_9EURO|nr:hypothetical protein BDV30DRAFT_4438 [Aspergillus minisclerotigenes]